MRKYLIPIVAAASAFAVTAPATAQYVRWSPPVYQYNPYNYNRGFSGVSFARTMMERVQRVRADIHVMRDRRVLSRGEARSLDVQAQNLERRIYRATRNGVSAREARNMENQIFNLQRRVAREANDWDRRYGHRRH
ncbi:MAG TPA: hypothetical protein VM145_05825 [Sphingomicrobium sp.]|nr:hypothetical protein [Sphingomicrobium sp.]